jgi:hypothetical protein
MRRFLDACDELIEQRVAELASRSQRLAGDQP